MVPIRALIARFIAKSFLMSRAMGRIKTFTLRGIEESPPYMHGGRCLTLEDTVESS
jgi:cytochrome c peroxidase